MLSVWERKQQIQVHCQQCNSDICVGKKLLCVCVKTPKDLGSSQGPKLSIALQCLLEPAGGALRLGNTNTVLYSIVGAGEEPSEAKVDIKNNITQGAMH